MNDHEIATALRRLLSQFESSIGDLATVTHVAVEEFERGTYGLMWIKPSRRMCTSLSVTRELLVLASNFPEQQVRMIAAAQFYTERSGGRLEPQVVIAVHQDVRGNQKLKEWGRERGLTILPVYVGAAPLATGTEFERVLCREMFSNDAFDVTGPVADEAQFYGRRTETVELARQLQTGQIRSCLGIRKVGKTSVINRVIHNMLAHHDCYTVMIDCSTEDVWSKSPSGLLAAIAAAAERASRSPGRYSTVAGGAPDEGMPNAAARLSHVVADAGRPLVLVFDEVDYITPGSPTAADWATGFNPFWRTIRAIYQESCRGGRSLSILVGGVSSKWFAVESIAGVENAALQFVPEEYLTPFARGASVAMIRRLGTTAGLRFDEGAADILASACSDMPFWIRKCCSYIHRQMPVESRPAMVRQESLRPMISAFIDSDGAAMAQVALSHLFRVYPELEPLCVSFLDNASRGDDPHLHRITVKYGLIAMENGRFQLGEMMRAGLELYKAGRSGSVQPAQPAPSVPVTPPLGDWAEDLAVVNRRRNVMEKRLRTLVLSVIRSDSIQDKAKQPVAQRITHCVPEARRRALAFKDPEDLIAKLYFLELIELVRKEWDLLSRVFSDLKEFEHHARIVNDRPDAHAKPFDVADFALQRRSLAWIEDRLAPY